MKYPGKRSLTSVLKVLSVTVDDKVFGNCPHSHRLSVPVFCVQPLKISPVNLFICCSLFPQFTEEYLRRIPHGERPRVIVVADGSCGDTCSVLGISSDYTAESCHAYGANATIERLDQRQVRTFNPVGAKWPTGCCLRKGWRRWKQDIAHLAMQPLSDLNKLLSKLRGARVN